MFDDSVGITGEAELAELDGPFVKISLRGRFWHKRSTVLARVANYLKQRIPVSPFSSLSFIFLAITLRLIVEKLVKAYHLSHPRQEILEVDIEDEKQLDDSPENFWLSSFFLFSFSVICYIETLNPCILWDKPL